MITAAQNGTETGVPRLTRVFQVCNREGLDSATRKNLRETVVCEHLVGVVPGAAADHAVEPPA
jgi:hypothetical protein